MRKSTEQRNARRAERIRRRDVRYLHNHAGWSVREICRSLMLSPEAVHAALEVNQ